MSVDLKKNIYIFSKFENYDGTAWNIVKDYMSISCVLMTKGKTLQKRIINEDLSSTGQEKKCAISRSLWGCIFKQEVLKMPNLAS